MARIDRDQLGLLLASAWALRGTCARRQVGCVLFDGHGRELSTGYNGPASGRPHCSEALAMRCPGADLPSGTGLDQCEAIHAEQNAIAACPDIAAVRVVYVTHSPCVHCVKMLMNTGARRIVFFEPYAHDAPARELWVKSRARWMTRTSDGRRSWEHVPVDITQWEHL